MSIKEKLLGTALDLTKNENIQNKTANLLGMLFPYVGIRKEAVSCYISEIEKSDLSPESKAFAIYNTKKTFKKFRNQQDIAQIAIENAKEGTDFSNNSKVDEEWLDRFMDSAGCVSNEDIKLIWGKILSKEYEKPGSTPFNMIRILSEITPKYAEAFKNICSMNRMMIVVDDNCNILQSRNDVVIPFKNNNQFLVKFGINFSSLNELETLGLLKFRPNQTYVDLNVPKGHILTYVNDYYGEFEKTMDSVPVGNVILTSAGQYLFDIVTKEKLNGFEEEERKYMLERNIKYKTETNFVVTFDGSLYRITKK